MACYDHKSIFFPAIPILSLILHLLLQHHFGGIISASRVTTNSSLVVGFSLVTNTEKACNIGLTNQGVYLLLEYREISAEASMHSKGGLSPWKQLDTISISNQCIGCRHNISSVLMLRRLESVQFRLIQFEHGGGCCNCWGLIPSSWTVQMEGMVMQQLSTVHLSCGYSGNLQSSNDCSNDFDIEMFCSGSASTPRGFISPLIYLGTNGTECPIELNEVVEQMGPPLVTQCSTISEKIILSFTIKFLNILSCDSPDSADEGVELAIRNWDEKGNWVPVSFFYVDPKRREEILLGSFSNHTSATTTVHIRGYDVPTDHFTRKAVKLEICDPSYLKHKMVQFRWLQTSIYSSSNILPVDVWKLDNVTVKFVNGSIEHIILKETFDSEPLNESLWRRDVRNGAVVNSTYCSQETGDMEGEENKALTFGNVINTRFTRGNIVSRLVTTAPLNFGEVDPEGMNKDTIHEIIEKHINHLEPEEAIEYLHNVTHNNDRNVNGTVMVDLMGRVLLKLRNRTGATSQLRKTALQDFIGIGNNIISFATKDELSNTEDSEGSYLLDIMDQFALEAITDDTELSEGNITLITSRAKNTALTVSFNSAQSSFPLGKTTTIYVPQEIMALYAKYAGNENGTRAVSFLYNNVDTLFPVVNRTRTMLASGVVSMAILCGAEICETSMLNLLSSVIITIEHSEINDNEEVVCVFWDFDERAERQDFRNGGHWSERGCTRNVSISSATKTVCECTHLTHFGILLSTNPPKLNPQVEFSLTVIGYVGTTVSLITMTLTVFTFIILKSLHNIRNYIHVNLCINLGIAQLIFVAGIDRTDPNSDVAPVHCQVIAVLLHYFFLVSFMWMLMEGVVLYVVLMRVFMVRKKHHIYMLAFTLASYGLPFLYMALITLPLGFTLPNGPHYGYKYVCFLKTDNFFIWAFIGPVVLIYLANIGFFIMAASIMWRHQMEQSHQKRLQNICNWLKSAVVLSVIMGVTWMPCFLVVDKKFNKLSEPLVYISTFLIAFQGIFIFLIFVVFSKVVWEAYGKWWKIKVSESELLSTYLGNKSTGTLPPSSSKKNGIFKHKNMRDLQNSFANTSTTALSFNSPSQLPPQPQHSPSTLTTDTLDSLDLVIPQYIQENAPVESPHWCSTPTESPNWCSTPAESPNWCSTPAESPRRCSFNRQESVFQVIYVPSTRNGETKDDCREKGDE